MEGWDRHCRLPGSTTALYIALWSRSECRLHINVLEFRVVCLTLLLLKQEIFGQTVQIWSNNTVTASYINRQGGVVSKTLNDKACALYKWAISRSLKLQAIHRLGINNELADYLSHNRPDPIEWHLSPLIAQHLFWRWGRPQVDLFASHQNHQLPCWFSWDRSPYGGGLQCPVPVVDRAVSLRLSPDPSAREDSDQDQGGSGGGHCHRPQLAEEILVPPTPPDGVQDPSPTTTPTPTLGGICHNAC